MPRDDAKRVWGRSHEYWIASFLAMTRSDNMGAALLRSRRSRSYNDAKRAWGRSPDKYVSASLCAGQPLCAGLSLCVIASEARQSRGEAIKKRECCQSCRRSHKQSQHECDALLLGKLVIWIASCLAMTRSVRGGEAQISTCLRRFALDCRFACPPLGEHRSNSFYIARVKNFKTMHYHSAKYVFLQL